MENFDNISSDFLSMAAGLLFTFATVLSKSGLVSHRQTPPSAGQRCSSLLYAQLDSKSYTSLPLKNLRQSNDFPRTPSSGGAPRAEQRFRGSSRKGSGPTPWMDSE